MALNLPGMDPERYALKTAVSIDPHVKEVIAQEVERRLEKERRTKLTWSSPEKAWKQRGVADPNWVGKPIGTDGFDLKLPYMSYNGEYYVQNCRIYLSNGTRISLEEVRNDALPLHAPCPNCRERNFPCTVREYVGRQLDQWRKQAVALDPMLCRFCFEHTADSPDEYAVHLASVHPEKIGQRLGFGLATPEPGSSSGSSSPSPSHSEGEPVETTPPAPPPPPLVVPKGTTTIDAAPAKGPIPVSTVAPAPKEEERGTFICGEANCGRAFEKKSALKRHGTRSHPRG